MKKVVIKIKCGKVSADYSGFQGRECEHLDERVRPGDMDIESQELKPEYHSVYSIHDNKVTYE